eukprot:3497728-Rhodomonas_salina.1
MLKKRILALQQQVYTAPSWPMSGTLPPSPSHGDRPYPSAALSWAELGYGVRGQTQIGYGSGC